ncbi:MAG: RNA polymerase sigma factor [Fluviicola sp.]
MLQKDFEQLYHDHVDMVYNLSLNYCSSEVDAQEITQDVFVTVYQKIEEFREESTLSTWITRITINKSLDLLRKRKRLSWLKPFSTSTPDAIDHFHPGVKMEHQESVKQLMNRIHELPERQRTALLLMKLEHKSLQEIAEIMELKPKAVESLISRAKENLLKKMHQSEG